VRLLYSIYSRKVKSVFLELGNDLNLLNFELYNDKYE